MRKITFLILILLGFSWQAQASLITDTITFDMLGAWDSEDGSNDINDAGFGDVNQLSHLEQISWIQDIELNADAILSDITLTVLFHSIIPYWDNEFYLTFDEECYTGSGYHNYPGPGSFTFNIDQCMLADNKLNVSLSAVWGPFYIDSSQLSIYTSDHANETALPLPASLILALLFGIIPPVRRNKR